jgi:quinol monooxygenase YgiN
MTTSSVHVVARVMALPGNAEMVKSALLQLIEPTRQEQGCIRYDLLQSHIDPNEFVFVEEWESNETITAHLDSSHVQDAFLEVGRLLAAAPVIHRYQLLSSSIGYEKSCKNENSS